MKHGGIGFITFILLTQNAVAGALPKDYALPAISLQQAISKAKACVAEKEIPLHDMYMRAAAFERARHPNQTGPDRGRHWAITWQRTGATLGGEVIALIYEDNSCTITYGE